MTADWSLATSRGFSLFPLHARTKNPAIPEWKPYMEVPASPAQISAWAARPYNTGVATGRVSGVVVLDCDNLLARVEAESRGIPATLTVATPRGTHFYFQHPGWDVSNHAGKRWTTFGGGPVVDGWDLRGDGGYVVGPGSYYVPTDEELVKGKLEGAYEIELDVPVAPAPAWLLELMAPREHRPSVPVRFAEETSAYGRKCLADEVAILEGCTSHVNDQINLSAFAIGQLVAGGEIEANEALEALTGALAVLGLEHEDKACGTLERGYDAGLKEPRAPERKEPRVAVEPLAVLGARAVAQPLPAGVIPPAPKVGAALNLAGPGDTCRTLHLSVEEMDDKQSHLAIEQWMGMQGMTVSYDAFADRVMLNGRVLSDDSERKAWFDVREMSNVKFSKDLFGEVVRNIAHANTFHPLCEWLDDVEREWDGIERIDSWLSTYLGVPSNSYTSAVGAIFLTAAVRRARQPGCKFDELLVLEGPQGINKSSAMAALCPMRDWFSEDFTVSMNSKELLEATQGKWIVEAPELSKLNNSEVEHVKHMLSRRWDRARMAYGRNAIERGRQWVGVATVNAETYLSDPTGNRRFWPVRCGTIDLVGIEADHAQLWAEAALRERAGGPTRLPQALWAIAADEQAERVSIDPIAEVLIQTLGHYENGKIRTDDVWGIVNVPVERRNAVGTRLGNAMRAMGWTRRRAKSHGRNYYAYYKGSEIPEIAFNDRSGKFEAMPPELSSA